MSIEFVNTRLIKHGSTEVRGPGAASFRIAAVRKATGGDGHTYEGRQVKGLTSVSAQVASRHITALVTAWAATADNLVVTGDVVGQANPKKATLNSALAYQLQLTIPGRESAQAALGNLTYFGVSSNGTTNPLALADDPTPDTPGAVTEGFYLTDASIGGDDILAVVGGTVAASWVRKASNAGDGNLYEVQQSRGIASVNGTLTFRDAATMLTVLDHAAGDLALVVSTGGGSATITAQNAQFFSLDGRLPDNVASAVGENTLGWSAVSDDGTAAALAIA